MTILFQLMQSTVDYAGLFPPAKLPLPEVVKNYESYLQSPERAMLGRLILPAKLLNDFEALAAVSLVPNPPFTPWKISILLPPASEEPSETSELESALELVDRFNQIQSDLQTPLGIVDAFEVRVGNAQQLKSTIACLPPTINSFLEFPINAADPLIELASQYREDHQVFAKIRTGGVTQELIPPPERVAAFIQSCARHKLGFKATAGLHHPMRAQYPLTYESNAPQAKLYGYLNIFVASAIAFTHQPDAQTLVNILTNEEPSRFEFTENELSFESFEVTTDQITQLRSDGIISFGSCSFVEPTSELRKIPNLSLASIFAN